MKHTRPLMAGIAALLLGAGANANPLGVAADFNFFALGGGNLSSDSQGPMFSGGALTLNNYGVASNMPANQTNLVVNGNFTLNGGTVKGHSFVNGDVQAGTYNFQGNLRSNGSVNLINGTVTGSVVAAGSVWTGFTTVNGGIQQNQPAATSPVNTLAAKNYLEANADFWKGFAANGNAVHQFGGYTLTGANSSLNVFTVSGALLAGSHTVNLNVPNSSTVLINVTGGSSGLTNMGINLNGLSRTKVLWNFADATSLSFSGVSVQGSVLAPRANVNFNNGNLEGTLIANTVNGNGQYHWYKFTGDLQVVPEPGTIAALSAGIGLLAARMRRRS